MSKMSSPVSKTPMPYSAVLGTGIANQVGPGAGTPVVRTSCPDGSSKLPAVPAAVGNGHSGSTPSPTGNW